MNTICWCQEINIPRQQHEVETIRPVPLSFVQSRSLLHQTLQSSGVHLQTTDQVVHVRLSGLIVQVTVGSQRFQKVDETKNNLSLQ